MSQEEKNIFEPELSLSELLKIRHEKLDAFIKDGKDPFKETVFQNDIKAKEIKERFDELEGQRFSLRQNYGKRIGRHLPMRWGRGYRLASASTMWVEGIQDFRSDIGDIIWCQRPCFQNQNGRDFHPMRKWLHSLAPTRKVSRSAGHRASLQAALFGPHYESSNSGYIQDKKRRDLLYQKLFR